LTACGGRADDDLVGLGLFAREWERTCGEVELHGALRGEQLN
jgi:hypothetical protein